VAALVAPAPSARLTGGLAGAVRPRNSLAMEWRDEGILLSARPHGEHAAIAEVFTAAHGRHFGVVRGGASRRMAPHLQPGTQVRLDWRARLGEHIGTFAVEPIKSRAHVLSDRHALAGLGALTAMVGMALPEREPHAAFYAATLPLFHGLGDPDWPAAYLRWELQLLEETGFALDLGACAVTGATEGLGFVSPRTGRAVARTAAGDWADRLLPLPDGLREGPLTVEAVLQGLAITSHFLTREIADPQDRPLPAARARLLDILARAAGPVSISGQTPPAPEV
jgi:DNA repair protein RecO (recombination protein O)